MGPGAGAGPVAGAGAATAIRESAPRIDSGTPRARDLLKAFVTPRILRSARSQFAGVNW